jgi:hypothetical protein
MLIVSNPNGGDRRSNQCERGDTLKDLGIERHVSSRAKRIASVPEEKFEAALAEAREEEAAVTRRAVEKLLTHNHRAQGTGENEWYTPPLLPALVRFRGAIEG